VGARGAWWWWWGGPSEGSAAGEGGGHTQARARGAWACQRPAAGHGLHSAGQACILRQVAELPPFKHLQPRPFTVKFSTHLPGPPGQRDVGRPQGVIARPPTLLQLERRRGVDVGDEGSKRGQRLRRVREGGRGLWATGAPAALIPGPRVAGHMLHPQLAPPAALLAAKVGSARTRAERGARWTDLAHTTIRPARREGGERTHKSRERRTLDRPGSHHQPPRSP